MALLFIPRWRLLSALAALGLNCAPVAAQAGSVQDLDAVNGLPDARLGSPSAAFKGLVLVEDAGRWLTYKAPGEKLSYAGFEAVAIRYNFFKSKLYSINVEVEGKRSTRGILKKLEADFGKIHSLEKHQIAKSNTELEIREWTGQKVYLLYKSAANGDGAQITFLDRPTWDQLQAPREQRNELYRAMMGGSFINGDF